MSANAKRIVTWLVVAFVLFYVLTQPGQSANLVNGAIGLLQDAAEALITFMQSLF